MDLSPSRKLEKFRHEALGAIAKAASPEEVEDLRLRFLGRKSDLTALLRTLGSLPLDERRTLGPLANSLKEEILAALGSRAQELWRDSLRDPEDPLRDLTLSGPALPLGRRHPLCIVGARILGVFERLGFSYCEGSEIESDENNFTILNIPEDHPARDMHDTLYLRGGCETADGGEVVPGKNIPLPSPISHLPSPISFL